MWLLMSRVPCAESAKITLLAHARFVLDAWWHANQVRPHRKPSGRAPAEVADECVRGVCPRRVFITSTNNHEKRDLASDWQRSREHVTGGQGALAQAGAYP